MTITTTESSVAYAGDGVTTGFPVPFVFFETDELEVIERVTATGVETVKSLTTDYTVTGGDGAIGTVTALAAPAATVTWTIRRATAQTQETALTAFGPLPAEAIELMADRVVAIMQEVVRDYGRGLLVPRTETGLVLPSSVDRADKYLQFDSLGNPTAVTEVVPGAVTISAFMETVLAAADSAAALVALNASRVLWGGTAGGTADVQTLSPATALASYVAGTMVAWVSPASVNTGAVTINISGLGAKNVVTYYGSLLIADDLPASTMCVAVYTGAAFVLMTPDKSPALNIAYFGDTAYYAGLNAGNPLLVFDANDYVSYDRAGDRAAVVTGGSLAPWRVGSGVQTDDTVSMAQTWARLESYTVTGTPAQKDFDLSTYITRGFKRFRVEFRNISPAAAALLRAYLSTDAGGTWKSAGADYGNAWRRDNAAVGANGGTGIGYIQLSGTTNVQTRASHGAGCSGVLEFCTDTTTAPVIVSTEARWLSATPALEHLRGSANTTFAGPVNAVRVQFVGQNFETYGSLHVFGSAA